MAVRHQINFAGIALEATVTDKALTADQWVREIRSIHSGESIIVGLDCELKPNTWIGQINKTAKMQLCVGTKCLILQPFHIDYIPQSIKSFLSDPNVTFVGVEVEVDVLVLRSEYGLNFTKTVDIQALAMARWPILGCCFRPGLKTLASYIAGLMMAKPLHVCRSNWEARALSFEQIEYACIDAYACYRIGCKLLNKN